ncbi:PAS domain-containing protein [Spirosoma endophyticum]|uniref:histidine kinase n=1 Tax=Spirosoma endophyticum TaxID=662367 RepID=A0A1I2EV73_9BACT|nr:PAS domain-containing protein [Spirosoma endophyticum]SFE96221.1 PAS domain S-box-containing protein [Spirosoma endophyticum]
MAIIPNPDDRPHPSVDFQTPVVTKDPALTDSDQQARLRAEDRLKLVTQAAQVYWWEWDCQTNQTRFSPNIEQIIGRHPAQAMPENLQLLHPDDRHIPRQAVEQAQKQGSDSFHYQVRCWAIPLEIRWLHVSGRLVEDAQGQLVGTIGTAQDITYHKQVERALRESEKQQAYLLRLSDSLRPLSDPIAIQQAAIRLLGQHLLADRVLYAEVNFADQSYFINDNYVTDEVQKVVGRFPLSFFGSTTETLNRGQAVVIPDVNQASYGEAEKANFLAVGVYAALVIPLLKKGQLVADLAVHQRRARQWTTTEIALVTETAERIQAALERARVEEALHESERFMQGVIRSLPLVIYLFDLIQRQPRYLSPQVNHLFGYTVDQMQTREQDLFEAFFHPDDRPRLDAHFARIRSGQPVGENHAGVFAITYRINHPQRGWVWVQSRDTVYARDADGTPTLLLGTAEDITERMSTAQAIEESEKRLRLAIEATELATWEWNLDTGEVYWNEQHFRLFGMPPQPQPLTAAVFMDHVHPDERERVSQLLQKAITERSAYNAEFCAIRDDGSTRWMSGYGRIVEEVNGKPRRLSGVMFDVDERRRAEDALKTADQRKDEFLAMLAHELRNPMSTLRSGLQILSLTDGKDETSRDTIAMMNRQTDHLVHMVDDLLDVSRISRGKIVLQKERVDLVEVVQAAAQSVRPLAEEQHRHLQVSLPPTPIYVAGDATRLTQVVTNLLANGVRYTDWGGQIWLSLEHRDSGAILQVRDNGIGIATEQLTNIFELFVQVDNSYSRSKGGLGLGLTLVKRLVEKHGGQVAARSEGVGKGSTFTIHLPSLTAAAEQVAKSTLLGTDPATTQRILVIDDNADAAMSLGMLLKLKGYEVHTRTSGRSGIEVAESLKPRVILLDIGMPELDGYETCRLIREQSWGRNLVVIALTGYGQMEDRQRTQEAGFDGHLVKPVDLAVLFELLTDLLDKGEKLLE